MGEFIVKAAPDADLYLVWSTVVDAPVWVGSRADLLADLREHDDNHPGSSPRHSAEARVARADATGSSTIAPQGLYGWGDESFTVMESSPPWPSDEPGSWQLPRGSLVAYAEALLADDMAKANECLVWAPYD